LTFSIATAISRISSFGTFGGKSCVKRPSIFSTFEFLFSPNPKNLSLPLRKELASFLMCANSAD
jgi:hypothetical protein